MVFARLEIWCASSAKILENQAFLGAVHFRRKQHKNLENQAFLRADTTEILENPVFLGADSTEILEIYHAWVQAA